VYSWAIGLAEVSRAYRNVNSVIQYLRLSSNVSTGISIHRLTESLMYNDCSEGAPRMAPPAVYA